MKRVWIAIILALALFVVLAARSQNLYKPQPVADRRTEQIFPEEWSFSNAKGEQVKIAMPVLQRFYYPGDSVFCDRVRALQQASGSGSDFINDCKNISTAPPLSRAQKLANMATFIPFNLSDGSQTKASGDEDSIGLALSSLREAMETVPRDEPEAALALLANYWIASFMKQPGRYFQPAFLFQDAFVAEVAQAVLGLCELIGRPDCAQSVPPEAATALKSVGRWHSDIGKLLLSIKLAEAQYNRQPKNNAYLEVSHAKAQAATYGYASEIVIGSQKLVYLRRGIEPLEKALARYGSELDTTELQFIIGSLGAAYGRLAFISRNKTDVEKAVRFDEDAIRLKTETKNEPSWENLSNLGDSLVLRGEVFKNEDDFNQGLHRQRQALVAAAAEKSPDGHAYVTMKLAQSLVRYVEAPETGLTHANRITMLKECKRLAAEAMAFFQISNTPVYLSLLGEIITRANIQLSTLGENFITSEQQPAPLSERR